MATTVDKLYYQIVSRDIHIYLRDYIIYMYNDDIINNPIMNNKITTEYRKYRECFNSIKNLPLNNHSLELYRTLSNDMEKSISEIRNSV